jgi:hypothetical protein
MTRFQPDTPAPLPPAEATHAEEESRDSLFERWLTRSRPSNASQHRLRSGVPAAPSQPAPPLGDELADAWFR